MYLFINMQTHLSHVNSSNINNNIESEKFKVIIIIHPIENSKGREWGECITTFMVQIDCSQPTFFFAGKEQQNGHWCIMGGTCIEK